MLNKGEVSGSKLLEIIKISLQKNKVVRPIYLNSDEKALVVASEYIEGDHRMAIDVNKL